MSTRTTDEGHVALFDSVTGFAFGPTFASAEHAEDFVDWLGAEPRGVPVSPIFTNDPRSARDPRSYSSAGLEALYTEWSKQRTDDEGDLIEGAS